MEEEFLAKYFETSRNPQELLTPLDSDIIAKFDCTSCSLRGGKNGKGIKKPGFWKNKWAKAAGVWLPD